MRLTGQAFGRWCALATISCLVVRHNDNHHHKTVTAFQVGVSPALLSSSRSRRASTSSTSALGVSEKLRPEEATVDVSTSENVDGLGTQEETDSTPVFELLGRHTPPPFKKVMAANRAEIAIRIMRACTELNMETVGIFGYEDRYSQHNWGADYSFMLEKQTESSSPMSAYLDIDQIIQIAQDNDVEAIHPGYGFLSESPEFATACEKAGITFVGPTVENLLTFSDKTSAREAAIAANVPVIPGSPALTNAEDVEKYVADIGLPVIIKAAMGGGGKGMRVVRNQEDLLPFFESASSEAAAAFGDGSVFVERYVEDPRHIEVQIVGDGTGNVVHLWERDCSIQRRHQKVIEMAPAFTLTDDVRQQLHEYAMKLTSKAKYRNAGTVEFLIDNQNRPYFIEVNPRIQVEHTVTEEVTGIDLVKAQLKIAGGATLEEVGLIQDNIRPRGVAIQCRVTTENPEKDFLPDTGRLTVYRASAGGGIRMDGVGYAGYTVTPYYDSLLCKYTARGSTFEETVARMKRVLQEIRIRGVKTNVQFLLNVLCHPVFERGIVTTSFIDQHPELKVVSSAAWNFASPDQKSTTSTYNTEKLMRYLANLAVNGHPPELGASAEILQQKAQSGQPIYVPAPLEAPAVAVDTERRSHRAILLEDGPEAYAKYIRDQKQLFVMDTTWRDAHQSLLATRMRTSELVKSADYTNAALKDAFSLEMWGGATFDVSMRFLKECPWERLEKLRAAVPDVPFQMLLRGANAVGYTNYPDNVVYEFCKQAKESGIDVFRVFDSLNYLPNLQLGVDAAKAAGAFVEGTISYTGDVADPTKTKYDLDYYVQLAKDLNDMGIHSLAIKDMAGLLTPQASTMLIGAIRDALPDIPIHVHTHDTAGNGIASMLAAANAGADIVDAAMDAFSGMTSQPSLGALVAAVKGTDLDTKLDMSHISELNTYWENVRSLYAPFESGQLSGSSDVYVHEIPGGQYTNLLFQSKQLGLTEKWPQIKRMYAEANRALGDIPKVTPSSKVVGDLAQFMVSQNLNTAEEVVEKADKLAFPESVVEFLRGEIGVPPGGFPEPFRSKVLNARGLTAVQGRPGAELDDYHFEEAEAILTKKYNGITYKDVLSHALYPKVFEDWKQHETIYGDISILPTDFFLYPLKEGEEKVLEPRRGKKFLIKLVSKEEADHEGSRMVTFQVNGERWFFDVTDHSLVSETAKREKAVDEGDIGSPMPGVIVALKVKVGDKVKEGEPVASLSAMKMETIIPATASGTIDRILINIGDKVDADDLLMSIA